MATYGSETLYLADVIGRLQAAMLRRLLAKGNLPSRVRNLGSTPRRDICERCKVFIRIKRFPSTTKRKAHKCTTHRVVAVREYDPAFDKNSYLISIVPKDRYPGFDNFYIQNRKTLHIGGRAGQVEFGAAIRGLRSAVRAGRDLATICGIAEIWVYSSEYNPNVNN
jgi:hypothetical protein